MEKQENLSEEESLAIITRMINQAKVNVNQGSFHLLLWGWIIFVASIAHFSLLKFSQMQNPQNVWLLVVPGFFISFIYGWRQGRNRKVSTYSGRIYMWIWLAFAIVFVIMYAIFIDLGGGINSLILLMAGYATFLSGQVLRFKPLVAGGILFWVFAILAYVIGNEYGLLITAVSVLTGYLIPGYLLKNKIKDVTF
jgi:hypothetical protein